MYSSQLRLLLKAKTAALRKSFTICTNNIEKTIGDAKSSTDDSIALQEWLQDTFRRLAESQEIVSAAILSKEDFASTFEKDFEEAETYRDRYCTYTTILEKVSGGNRELVMRCLSDSGSENSYITQRAISQSSLRRIGKQTLVHVCLERESSPKQHSKYNIKIKSLKGNFSCRLEVLSKEKICGILPKITDKCLNSELEKNVMFQMYVGSRLLDIDLLLKADALGLIYKGKLIKLECGLTAVETHLGFALMG
ncbi:uncharacterized protein TNCV_2953401 [Trichonephila clavipes]|nr:uncharacterized protein TNCV_2953401 [Trichonephila clavipes]